MLGARAERPLYAGLKTWFAGTDLRFDLSSVHPTDAPLPTCGGGTSGPLSHAALRALGRDGLLGVQRCCLRLLDPVEGIVR